LEEVFGEGSSKDMMVINHKPGRAFRPPGEIIREEASELACVGGRGVSRQ
jgi:hypothetical protein